MPGVQHPWKGAHLGSAQSEAWQARPALTLGADRTFPECFHLDCPILTLLPPREAQRPPLLLMRLALRSADWPVDTQHFRHRGPVPVSLTLSLPLVAGVKKVVWGHGVDPVRWQHRPSEGEGRMATLCSLCLWGQARAILCEVPWRGLAASHL